MPATITSACCNFYTGLKRSSKSTFNGRAAAEEVLAGFLTADFYGRAAVAAAKEVRLSFRLSAPLTLLANSWCRPAQRPPRAAAFAANAAMDALDQRGELMSERMYRLRRELYEPCGPEVSLRESP